MEEIVSPRRWEVRIRHSTDKQENYGWDSGKQSKIVYSEAESAIKKQRRRETGGKNLEDATGDGKF